MMVERTTERRTVLLEVDERDADTLLSAIFRHVEKGTNIINDGWKVYRKLSFWFKHQTVRHNKRDKDPITQTHTIEGAWTGV